MKPAILLSLAAVFATTASAIDISRADAARIGQRVWQNECDGTVEGLVSWNAGEAFPSLGIGHFIWYPAGRPGPFEESFPQLVALLERRGVEVPAWLRGPAPWQTRSAMLDDKGRVKELRSLLSRTIDIQAEFLADRLEAALPKMLDAAASQDRDRVRERFERLAASPAGTFALVDYVNFKGEGTQPTERYNGQGWGLLQVLEGMNDSASPVRDFAESARRTLIRRVKNSPPARGEGRWLPGWEARVNRYASAGS